MRRLLLVLVFALVSAPSGVAAQAAAEPAPSAVSAEAAPSAAADVTAQTPNTTSGLPQRGAAPRTLRAYWHVFIAFAVTWLLLFGYALSIGRRFGKLEDEVARLRR